MLALTMTTSDLHLLSTRDVASLKTAGTPLQVLIKSLAALIVLTALIAPDCCLRGSHAHGADFDGFAPVCFTGAAWR